MSNSHGNTSRDVRRFLRSVGVKPSVDNVERIGREVRRTEAQNERQEVLGREMGLGPRDGGGDVKSRVERQVRAEMARRKKRR